MAILSYDDDNNVDDTKWYNTSEAVKLMIVNRIKVVHNKITAPSNSIAVIIWAEKFQILTLVVFCFCSVIRPVFDCCSWASMFSNKPVKRYSFYSMSVHSN